MKLSPYLIVLFLIYYISFGQNNSEVKAVSILKKIDYNMTSKSQILTSEMIVYGKRKSRKIRSKGYSLGQNKNFTEYLYPEREKGIKMLKLENRLWIYSPSTDRIIQLSGHLLRQSVMGSDLSYEDMMDDRKLAEVYDPKMAGEETLDNSSVWKLELTAKVSDVSYYRRILWVDKEKFVPLKEELYAKSGELLKRTLLSNIKKTDGRWFPRKMNYKDVLKSGQGTDFIIKDVRFNVPIADETFLKSSLKK
jgi:outer membrane lipoprotein-sorting protein